MRAIRYHGGADLRLEDVPEPTGEVVVRVEACGVCGSDLHFLDGTARTSRTPIILGHEISGTIERSAVPDWALGDEVVVAAGVSCGTCPRCLDGRSNLCDTVQMTGIDFDGGWAELVAVPPSALSRRPAGMDPAIAAVAADAGATALHAIARRGEVTEGSSVAVIGVGGLGTFALQIAKLLGAAPIIAIDTDQGARDSALRLGADLVIDPAAVDSVGREVKMATEGGVDVAAEFVGLPATVDNAIKSLRRGGIAVATGIGTDPLHTLPPTLWAMSEYELRGSFGSLPGDTEQVLEWLAAAAIEPPPLARVQLDVAVEAISAAAASPGHGRVVVVMT